MTDARTICTRTQVLTFNNGTLRYVRTYDFRIRVTLTFKVFSWLGPGDRGSIHGRVIPKSQKMVLDTALLDTQRYKVRIKGKVEQSREWSRALTDTSV